MYVRKRRKDDQSYRPLHQRISSLWIVFDPEIRDKIPTPNKMEITGEKYNRKANQRGYPTAKQLQLINGIPLKGTKKEDMQQDLEELLKVTENEMDLWRLLGLSPNNSIDYQKLDWEAMYYVDGDNNISQTKMKECQIEMVGEKLAHWLTDKIIIDVENPPYRFV